MILYKGLQTLCSPIAFLFSGKLRYTTIAGGHSASPEVPEYYWGHIRILLLVNGATLPAGPAPTCLLGNVGACHFRSGEKCMQFIAAWSRTEDDRTYGVHPEVLISARLAPIPSRTLLYVVWLL